MEVGTGNSLIVPVGVMRPILYTLPSVNQRLWSGPAAMPKGELLGVDRGNSLILLAAGLFVAAGVGEAVPPQPAMKNRLLSTSTLKVMLRMQCSFVLIG